MATLDYIAHQMVLPKNRVSVWAESKDLQPPTTIPHKGRRLLEDVPRLQRRQNRLQGPFGLDRKVSFLQNNNPWHIYTRILTAEQAGPVIVASSRKRDPKVVAVKKLQGYKIADFKSLVKPANENIVKLHSAFYFDLDIYLISERIKVCLNEALSTPRGKLPHQEVATICRSLLNGLNYIQGEMDAVHGNIDGSTVLLLPENGQVKIANVAEQILSWRMHPVQVRDKKVSQREDIDAVARLLVQMCEPDTTIRNPNSKELQRPSQSHDAVVSMLDAMRTETCTQLLKHELITEAREDFYLMPYILAAESLKNQKIEIFLA